MKPFNLEAFKAGQKALTRDRRVATFVDVYEDCYSLEETLVFTVMGVHRSMIMAATLAGRHSNDKEESKHDLVSMVSRHQALIDAYNPDDTWQFSIKTYDKWFDIEGKPEWEENREFRIHPHNDLIKAWKKGAKIECKHKDKEWRDASSDDIGSWCEDAEYRIKPELEFTYPIYKQSKSSNVVVEFTDLTTGKVLVVGDSFYVVGHVQDIWTPHTDASVWQDWTPITKPEPTIHCLAYDASLDTNPKLWGAPVVSEKQFAVKKGWRIIQEWEV